MEHRVQNGKNNTAYENDYAQSALGTVCPFGRLFFDFT